MDKADFAQVGASYGMIWMGDPKYEFTEPLGTGELVDRHPPFGFYLLTETHTGPVGIMIKLESMPVEFDRSTWLVEEFDIELSSKVFSAVPMMGDGDSPDIVLPRSGRYHITVLGTDREDTGEWDAPADERYVVFLEMPPI